MSLQKFDRPSLCWNPVAGVLVRFASCIFFKKEPSESKQEKAVAEWNASVNKQASQHTTRYDASQDEVCELLAGFAHHRDTLFSMREQTSEYESQALS